MRTQVNTDAELAALATRQYGLVASHQLGLGKAAVTRRVGAGRLHVVHKGVYAVGHLGLGREGRWLAAVLACGEGAALSHRSAAALWGIRDWELRRPEVTARTVKRHAGIASHRGRLLDADRALHLRIPVTSPSRTLVDLAHLLDEDDLVRALREAMWRRLYDRPALDDALARRPSVKLQRLLNAVDVTQSELEDRFLWVCDRHRLPKPRTQHRIGARTYDFAWPEQRVVVETDGWRAHGTPHAFQADRTSSNALQLAGWLVLRFTREDLTRRARRVARDVRTALAMG